jgi:hypothetical protein
VVPVSNLAHLFWRSLLHRTLTKWLVLSFQYQISSAVYANPIHQVMFTLTPWATRRKNSSTLEICGPILFIASRQKESKQLIETLVIVVGIFSGKLRQCK